MSARKAIFKIPSRGDRTKWVNSYNLLKLSGVGGGIASCLDFAIDHLFSPGDGDVIAEQGRNLLVQVYPKHVTRAPQFVEGLTGDELRRAKNDSTNSDYVTINDQIVHLSPDGRPVILKTYDVTGPRDAKSIIDVVVISDPSIGPVFNYTSLPLRSVVQENRNYKNEYVVYCHSISPKTDLTSGSIEKATDADQHMHYVGLTKQGWKKRLSQHLSCARSGSPLLFHRALREHYIGTLAVGHHVLWIGDTEKEAMDTEELYVEGESKDIQGAEHYHRLESWFFGTLYPKGLNMIPGGYAGLRVLHKMGVLKENTVVNVDIRDDLLIKAIKREGIQGRSNPLLAAHWNDEDYATRIICGPEGRLKPVQIKEARMLGFLGRDAAEIKETVGAKNEQQIDRLLKGKTYSRIKSK